jgi:sortase (surface protein transpeptidase)
VFTHKIVGANDMAVLKSHGREVVELQACHPRFFASQRYIVFARLMQIDPRGAPPITPAARTLAAAPYASTQG